MSKNFYTTTTAALKATKANIRQIDAKQIKLNGKSIPSKVIDDRGDSVTDQDLWGTSVTTDENGVIQVSHMLLGNPNSSRAWNSSVKAVQNNKAYSEITTDADGKFTGVVEESFVANIQTEMIYSGSNMFHDTSLTSFIGDLSNLVGGRNMFSNTALESFNSYLSSLVNGDSMFSYTALESFRTDLSSLVNGTGMFNGSSLTSFSSDLSSLEIGSQMFYYTSLESFNSNLSSLVEGENMFNATSLKSFNGDLSSLVSADGMFYYTPLESFSGDLSSLVYGSHMFKHTSLTSFNGDLSNLLVGNNMFSHGTLESFTGDLSSLLNAHSMFSDTPLTSFIGDLSSLICGNNMFLNCSLDTESVECIADTIRNVTDLSGSITGSDGKTYIASKLINIDIANETPNEAENAAFWIMKNEKGWDVLVKGSSYNPTEPTAIATLDENGEEATTPIPFWAKPVETDEEHAEYVGEDGKFYNVVGGQFIYVSDPETYGQFISLADAVANMRLTKYEKPQEEA